MTDNEDDTGSNPRINRRKYLAMSAVGATGLAAGCGGDGGDGGGDGGDGGDGDGGGDGGDGDDMDGGDGGGSDGDDMDGGGGEAIPLASFCPLSGAGGAFGPGQQAGFNMAIEDMNEAGGILGGRTFEPINRDTETKPSRASSKLNEVISNENIEAFVGTWSSGVSATLAPIAADNQIMQMGNGTTSPTLAEQGWREVDGELLKYMGRTSPNDGSQGIAMAGALNDIIEADSAAFMHVDNPYGAGLARKASEAFNGETTAMVPVAKQTSDYTSALDQAFADDPDVFGLIVYPANGESILKQWNRGGYGGQLVMSESLFLQDLFNSLPDIFADSYITSMKIEGPSKDYFESNLQDRMDQKPTSFSHHSFDSTMLIGLAAHAAGEFSGTAISKNIQAVSRSPGEKIGAGPDEFQRAKDLLDDGEQINYQGASSTCDLNCFYEPYNPFQVYQLNKEDDSTITPEVVDEFPVDFFQGKLYTQEQLDKYNCG